MHDEAVLAKVGREFRRLKPRNHLVTIKRLRGEAKTGAGVIMPEGYGSFDLAEVVDVGAGSAAMVDSSRCGDTDDLRPGMIVIVKTAHKVQSANGQSGKAEHTLPFTVNGEKVELVQQQDIMAICE